MAYDSLRQRAVLFGGRSLGFQILGDTWEWDGDRWEQRLPAVEPPRTHNHAMAFDVFRRRTIMFGGVTPSGGANGDTWEWDGATWEKRVSSVSPSGRQIAAMAFDERRGRTVLFGGFDGSLRNDTWEFDGQQWAEIAPAFQVRPEPRWGHHMAFDPRTGQVMLFGGRGRRGSLNDTWLWDGQVWTELQPATRPPARADHILVYDSLRERMVTYAGFALSDTWEWDGTDWVERTPSVSPGERCCHAAVYDSARDEVVMFGGTPSFSLQTWRYQTAARANVEPLGAGCLGSVGVPRLESSTLPWTGTTWQGSVSQLPRGARVEVLVGVSKSAWGQVPLPFSLDGIGGAGCTLFVSVDQALTAFSSSGTASWSLPVPASADLAGRTLYLQGVVLDPPANALGVTMTDAIATQIGIR